jgi:hypothetical protein
MMHLSLRGFDYNYNLTRDMQSERGFHFLHFQGRAKRHMRGFASRLNHQVAFQRQGLDLA